MFGKKEKRSLIAAVLSFAVCISDIMNKFVMCGRSVEYVLGQPFSTLHW